MRWQSPVERRACALDQCSKTERFERCLREKRIDNAKARSQSSAEIEPTDCLVTLPPPQPIHRLARAIAHPKPDPRPRTGQNCSRAWPASRAVKLATAAAGLVL